MESKHNFIGSYLDKSPKERIYHLLDHYRDFDQYRDNYKDTVINLMVAMSEYNNRSKREDLGIRVQTSKGTSDITAAKAIERVALEECFEQMRVTKELFPNPDELGLISTAVYEWDLMGKEFDILAGFINLMRPDERNLFLPYIRREKRVAEIADELRLEWESANKRVYRIRKALLENVLPWFNEYKITAPA